MTDRELLERAARAAGWIYHAPGQIDINRPDLDGWIDPLTGDVHWRDLWRPLTDDGDALRLAVRLNLVVECMAGQTAARTFDSLHAGACDYPGQRSDGCGRDHAPDAFAATRRAIVRAAAAMAPAMRTDDAQT